MLCECACVIFPKCYRVLKSLMLATNFCGVFACADVHLKQILNQITLMHTNSNEILFPVYLTKKLI